MENDIDSLEIARHQKELEERIENLQGLLEKECCDHVKDNKRYLLLFHQLLKDLQKIARIEVIIKRESHEDEPTQGMVAFDKKVIEDIIKEIGRFHDKYSDKSYAFLKEIIRNE